MVFSKNSFSGDVRAVLTKKTPRSCRDILHRGAVAAVRMGGPLVAVGVIDAMGVLGCQHKKDKGTTRTRKSAAGLA